MTIANACTTLGFTTITDPRQLARLASSRLSNLNFNAPLKIKVACMTLIRDAS
jgi:hypothetical protein